MLTQGLPPRHSQLSTPIQCLVGVIPSAGSVMKIKMLPGLLTCMACITANADEKWTIEITPTNKVVDDASQVVKTRDGKEVNLADYQRVYRSIPFNRVEYNVNRGYRHDAAMELLTGNSRHVTVVRHGAAPQAAAPRRPGNTIIPYGFVRPSVRLNYYRHFPSLNPYWSLWHFNGIY